MYVDELIGFNIVNILFFLMIDVCVDYCDVDNWVEINIEVIKEVMENFKDFDININID